MLAGRHLFERELSNVPWLCRSCWDLNDLAAILVVIAAGDIIPVAAENGRRVRSLVFGLLFTMRFATHACLPH